MQGFFYDKVCNPAFLGQSAQLEKDATNKMLVCKHLDTNKKALAEKNCKMRYGF
jgi:hypothetical protein